MKTLGIILSLTLVACGATVPVPSKPPPRPDESKVVDRIGTRINAAGEKTAETVEKAVLSLRRDVQVARQKSEMALEAVEKQGKGRVRVITKERVVPVPDPTFSKDDRDHLLRRADEQVQKLKQAIAQAQKLGRTVQDMQEKIDNFKEFTDSPGAFVRTYGISGLLLLLASIGSYLLGIKQRRK